MITAAREEFAERGLEVPLSAIAKRAGVGQGSLYRHFPSRLLLAAAVLEENIGELEARFSGSELGLAPFLEMIAMQAHASGALAALLRSEAGDPRVQELGLRILTLVDVILEREDRAGHLRGEVSAEDVMLGIEMVAGVMAGTAQERAQETARRACALVLGGILREG